jgi:large subunit ribosomal protein L9
MEILLLQDVANVGKKNDLLVVGDGFALNFLLPRRLALVATPVVRRRFAESIRKRAEEREKEKSARANAAGALSGKSLTFSKKVTKTGKLYAAITEKILADALRQEHKISVDQKDIEIGLPIKAVGSYVVQIRFGDTSAPLKVDVVAEDSVK